MMNTFTYIARTALGQQMEGTLQAPERNAAITILKKRGYFLLSLDLQDSLWSTWRQRFNQQRFSLRQRAVFTQQLATLLKAGLTLNIALKTLTSQMEDKSWSSLIEQLQQDIEGADSLSVAMAKHPQVFSSVYTAIVAGAEQTGQLPETLATLSQQLKNQASIQARVRGALVYPIFLLVVGGAVVAVLVSFVVPKFVTLFVNAQQTLPLPTRILVGAIDWIQQGWWLGLLFFMGLLALAGWSYRQERCRLAVDALLLRLPLVGPLNLKLQTARFARTLGTLLMGGVRIIEAFAIAQKTTSNLVFARGVSLAAKMISKGQSPAQALKAQNLFSEVLINMVLVGEETATLPEMLDEVAQIYEQEAETAIAAITNLLGPCMIIGLGLLIGFVVLAILLPIFETTSLIG